MALLTVLLLGLTTAIPIRPSPEVTFRPSPYGETTCDTPTVYSLSHLPPANWRDCAALHSDITRGVYTVHPVETNPVSNKTTPFIPLIEYRSCTLAVSPMTGAFIGDEDLNHMLVAALNGASAGSELAAGGDVVCDALKVYNDRGMVGWRVYDGRVDRFGVIG